MASTPRQRLAGRLRSLYGNAARGVPYGPDDGTIASPSILASLAFVRERHRNR